MESDPNPFPNLELFSPTAKLSRVANFIRKLIPTMPTGSELAQRGAESFLEQQLFTEDLSGTYHDEDKLW